MSNKDKPTSQQRLDQLLQLDTIVRLKLKLVAPYVEIYAAQRATEPDAIETAIDNITAVLKDIQRDLDKGLT